MSTPSYTHDREPAPRRPGGSSPVMKIAATAAAVAVLALGASVAISKTSSSSGTSGTQSTRSAQPAGGPAGGPQLGTAVTGATLTKLKAVVTAKYPGTIERAMKLSDGSYEVHVIPSSGTEVHVLVSQDFKITGTQQGGPPGGAPQAGQAPPSGQTAPSTSGSATQS